ncbi:MAG: 16S rRNA (guanine(966)-N(2))-methyltransferase RsmD [Egibacteraceae bacterium]
MRVIGGQLRGRRLRAPPGRDTRPTSDRVREALFSSLSDRVVGARVLDLFAGSGALGIEALSRGADLAVLVEADRRTAGVLQDNLRQLGLEDHASLSVTTAEQFCLQPHPAPFEVVLLDPPYRTPQPALVSLLADLNDAGGLAADAAIVIERDRRDPDLDAPLPPFLARDRLRQYGDTVLLYLRGAKA